MATEESVAVAAAVTVLPDFRKADPASRASKVSAPRLTLLRRRDPELTVISDAAVEAVELPVQPPAPAVEQQVVEHREPAEPAPATVAELQVALQRERERADAAESANAVLRRKLAQLDDELAQFRPRAIVPFEDSTD